MAYLFETSTGTMGSRFISLQVPPDCFRDMARIDWSECFKRVFIDPVTGSISFMAPSASHENRSSSSDLVMMSLDRKGFPVHGLGSTRFRGPGDREAEPDACYYVGVKVERYLAAVEEGNEALDQFARETPPDLVLEVERSHADRGKPSFYRDLGVTEMWRLDMSENDRDEVAFLDLQAPGGPAPSGFSIVLPGATPAFILEALGLAARRRYEELDALLDRLLLDMRQAGPADRPVGP